MRPIPEADLAPAALRGTLETVSYGRKSLLVYHPAAEPAAVLYLIHGGGDSPASFLCPPFVNLLDHMMERGEIPPLLVAAPSFYDPEETDKRPAHSGELVRVFSRELREQVIPAVEGKPVDRDHRAIGGFSMGGVTTWYAFLQARDLFSRFLPLSGDCWVCGEKGGGAQPLETARILAEAAGQPPTDFFIHAVTGSRDIACPNLSAQMEAMRRFPGQFRFGENVRFDVMEGGVHNYDCIFRYVYNVLPGFFKQV